MAKQKRKYWGKKDLPLPELDLLAVQQESYGEFLTDGIAKYLRKVSPIEDFTGKNWELTFGEHYFEEPELTPTEALKKGLTYDMPLRVKVTLTNKQSGESKEQDVFLGDIPKMTEKGTFVIKGIERAVVNQLIRSPGAFFSGEINKTSGRVLHTAEVRPIRGSWLEIDINRRDVISAKIDRHRKFPATILLKALGMTEDEIKEEFQQVDKDKEHRYIFTTLAKDDAESKEDALLAIYEKVRPGEPLVLDNAKELFFQSFFDPRRYDLAKVGRYKLNKKFDLDIENEPKNHVLQKQDFIETIRYLVKLQNGEGEVDDIDHLANRRVRRVGELVGSTSFRIGLLRLERSIREKMSRIKPSEEDTTPVQLINARPIIAIISQFFRRNRLSTILDQTNPLAEVDNLRRLSVMGTGGVTRERASFSMRDINESQYSRICPVRSPEGPNIGLVTYLSLYTRVNKFGFLEAPYRKVKKTKKDGEKVMQITDEVEYLQADDEEQYHITHSGIDIDEDNIIREKWVPARHDGDFVEVPVEKIDYIDVVPRQVIGTSASLIPFISNDEANRALMGTHMQCQAVPLVKPDSPVVGTGMEEKVASSMKRVVHAIHKGTVDYVDSEKVVIDLPKPEYEDAREHHKNHSEEHIEYHRGKEIYDLIKFYRTSQSTCYNQKPLVKVGQKVKKGDTIIDGPSAEDGELALGKNLVISYTSFEGLGYEDAIIISDRLVKEDLLTSIYINEYEAEVMDTKLGPEELTRDIPNVSEHELRNLGKDGIVTVGSEVGPHDILVGKIAPKGETELTAEERLLRSIFGEKAREVRDTSLKMPHGESGTVIDVQILDRAEGDELDPGELQKVKIKVAQLRKITVGDKLAGRHGNKGVISRIIPRADMPYLEDGTPVDIIISPLSVLARMNLGQILESTLGWAVDKLGYKVALPVFEEHEEERIEKLLKEADLPVSGKTTLYDGRTGKPFDKSSVVGIGYILKLIHMVHDKSHARSTGPYSLVTQQPLGGKAQMGGQRLGEMEVWALEAHRAAHTLKEMLTVKSDDIIGRSRAYEAMVKGQKIPEATVPESFKVLLKELNSLGLDVELIEPKEEEPELTAEENPLKRTEEDKEESKDETEEAEDTETEKEETEGEEK